MHPRSKSITYTAGSGALGALAGFRRAGALGALAGFRRARALGALAGFRRSRGAADGTIVARQESHEQFFVFVKDGFVFSARGAARLIRLLLLLFFFHNIEHFRPTTGVSFLAKDGRGAGQNQENSEKSSEHHD